MFLTRLGVPRLWHRDPELLWPWLRRTASPVTMLLAPSYAYGVERVPASGGGVVAANHLSAIDPPLVGTLCPRTIFYMTKVELLSMPIVGEALQWTGAFPVRRGEGDRESLRQAREIARVGHMVGVFVEGTRQRFGYPGHVLSGAMMIAVQEGVPIIPCGVYSFGWSLRNRMSCAVVWGEPLDLTDLPRAGRGYKRAAEIVGAEILRLWRQAAEAAGAGFPERLADGSARVGPAWRPLKVARTSRPATGVKKAAA